MNRFQLSYKPMGESALLIEWPKEISEDILKDIRLLALKLKSNTINGIEDVNFVYQSMLVLYDNTILTKESLIEKIQCLYTETGTDELVVPKTWYIPVCYEYGLDLEHVLNENKLNRDTLIQLHTKPTYKVYGIGFLPGFLYLGGLDERLKIPRKQTPRLNVFEGAVAIGGKQTGIYPQESPGGWHIIGKTPIPLFDSTKESPTFVNPGDQIKFYEVSESRYKVLEIEISSGIYNFNSSI